MPKPRKDEKKNDFIRRCVHDLVHQENRTPDQAVAVCYGIWNEHNKGYLADVLFFHFLKGNKVLIVECSRCGEQISYLDQPEVHMGSIACPRCGLEIAQPK